MRASTRTVPGSLREALRSHGWLHIDSLGVDGGDLAEARYLLDGLFDRFASLPLEVAQDLGGGHDRDNPLVPEVLDTSRLEPRLQDTELYACAHRLARSILGKDAYLAYDHAIYKPPGPSAPTSWHQDSGYDEVLQHALAIWIPFQDTGIIDGCMRYVTGSHLGGRLAHSTRIGFDGKVIRSLEINDDTATDVPCRLGGATLHDFHLVHGARPNLGANVRRAWILDFSTAPAARRVARAIKHTWSR